MRPANDNARSSPLRLRQMPKGNLWFAAIGSLVALLAIVAGLLTINPPWIVRQIRIDNERANGLSALSEAVGRFAREKGRLPKSLDELQEQGAGYQPHRAAVDPVSGATFEYLPGAGLDYQLCASFDRTSKDPQGRQQTEWPHETGRTCFSRVAPAK